MSTHYEAEPMCEELFTYDEGREVSGKREGQDVHLEPGSVRDSDELILTDLAGYRYKRQIDPELNIWRFKRL